MFVKLLVGLIAEMLTGGGQQLAPQPLRLRDYGIEIKRGESFGDFDGNGKADLLDYAALQIMTGRRPIKTCLVRGDGETLALRPATATFLDSQGNILHTVPVQRGCFDAPAGLEVEVRMEDANCLPGGAAKWVCHYEVWVESHVNADGSVKATICTEGATTVHSDYGFTITLGMATCVTVEGAGHE